MKAGWLLTVMFCSLHPYAQSLELAKNGVSTYSIALPAKASSSDTKAAQVLQDYFYRVTGVRLPVTRNSQPASPVFYIGFHPTNSTGKEIAALPADAFIIRTIGKNIMIAGNGVKGSLYGVYDFIEKYLGCRKWDGHTAFSPRRTDLYMPAMISETNKPVFQYREIYFSPAFDDEYLDWHKLQRFENLWGLWGHSFFKLVSPKIYYRTHPEYFSLVNNKREPTQLCLSNAMVLKIAVDQLQKLMAENPGAQYWSVSPNDDGGNCECDNCSKLDAADGGPQGSLIHFVNAVAARFPKKTFTTLAYGYTARATTQTRPAGNVVIMLSSIDAYRTKPLEKEPSAAGFRNNLARWKTKTSNLFVWDYYTQFTNYLAPFPISTTIASNILSLSAHGIKGIFAQGGGDSYSDMAELQSYLLAKFLWNPSADAEKLTQEFLDGYYGKAAPAVNNYLSLLQRTVSANSTKLDIYGNPVNDHAGYLSPANMDAFSSLLDKAEELAEDEKISLQHVQAVRLSLEYVYLQQLKFYGKDQHGLFIRNSDNTFSVRTGLLKRVERFTDRCKIAGVKEMSEGGIPPQKYLTQWRSIINTEPKNNLAAGASVKFTYPFAPEYPSKKERTLVDETPGYEDFSYNWLCFYGTPMEVVVDMGKVKKVNTISMHFLEDARHWIFRPASVTIEVSAGGLQYEALPVIINPAPEEDYAVNRLPMRFTVAVPIRYIRVKAANQPGLPAWRYHKYKKPMIACDEIWVE